MQILTNRNYKLMELESSKLVLSHHILISLYKVWTTYRVNLKKWASIFYEQLMNLNSHLQKTNRKTKNLTQLRSFWNIRREKLISWSVLFLKKGDKINNLSALIMFLLINHRPANKINKAGKFKELISNNQLIKIQHKEASNKSQMIRINFTSKISSSINQRNFNKPHL